MDWTLDMDTDFGQVTTQLTTHIVFADPQTILSVVGSKTIDRGIFSVTVKDVAFVPYTAQPKWFFVFFGYNLNKIVDNRTILSL
jgi:hypothetical protein